MRYPLGCDRRRRIEILVVIAPVVLLTGLIVHEQLYSAPSRPVGVPLAASPGQTEAIVVESKTVTLGSSNATVAISVANSVNVGALDIPLIARSLSGGAYWLGPVDSLHAYGRLASALKDARYFRSSPSSGTPTQVDLAYIKMISSPCLAPGPLQAMTGLRFNANENLGQFMLDTAFFAPSSRLTMLDCATSQRLPCEFTPGVITVAQNQCPTITGFGANPVEVTVGQVAHNTTTAVDPEGDHITYYLSEDRGTVDPATGTWAYTPTCGDVPGFVIAIEASDRGRDQCPASTFNVIVWPPALSITSCENVSVECGALAEQTIVAEGGCPPRVFTKISGPGSVNALSGAWSWQTQCNQIGIQTVSIVVTDAVGQKDTCTFTALVARPLCSIIGPDADTVLAGSTLTASFSVGPGECVDPQAIGSGFFIADGDIGMIDSETGLFTYTSSIQHGVLHNLTIGWHQNNDTIFHPFTVRLDDRHEIIECPQSLAVRTGMTATAQVTWLSDPAHPGAIVSAIGPGSINATTGLWTWTPSISDTGLHTVSVSLSSQQSPLCSFDVDVINGPPEAVNCDTVRVASGDTVQFLYEIFDHDGDPVVATLSSFNGPHSPAHMPTFALVPEMGLAPNYGVWQVRWLPTAADEGEWTATVDFHDSYHAGTEQCSRVILVTAPSGRIQHFDAFASSPDGAYREIDLNDALLSVSLPDSLSGQVAKSRLTGTLVCELHPTPIPTIDSVELKYMGLSGTPILFRRPDGTAGSTGDITIGLESQNAMVGTLDRESGLLQLSMSANITLDIMADNPAFVDTTDTDNTHIIPQAMPLTLTATLASAIADTTMIAAGTITGVAPLTLPLFAARAIYIDLPGIPVRIAWWWVKRELCVIYANAPGVAGDMKDRNQDANSIWQPQCCIHIRWHKHIALPAATHGYTAPYDDPKDDAQWFKDPLSQNKKCQVVLVSTGLNIAPPTAGVTTDRKWVVVSAAGGPNGPGRTLAHELGHILGLGDTGANGDLMGPAGPPGPNTRLKCTECETARANRSKLRTLWWWPCVGICWK